MYGVQFDRSSIVTNNASMYLHETSDTNVKNHFFVETLLYLEWYSSLHLGSPDNVPCIHALSCTLLSFLQAGK